MLDTTDTRRHKDRRIMAIIVTVVELEEHLERCLLAARWIVAVAESIRIYCTLKWLKFSHLERDRHQKLLVSRVISNEYTQRSINCFLRYLADKYRLHTDTGMRVRPSTSRRPTAWHRFGELCSEWNLWLFLT